MKVKQASKKKEYNRLMPVMGLFLALGFAVVALLVVQPAHTWLRAQGVTFGSLDLNVQRLLVGVMIWMVLFGISMLLVAVLTGRNPDEKETLAFYKEQQRRRKEMQKKKGKR